MHLKMFNISAIDLAYICKLLNCTLSIKNVDNPHSSTTTGYVLKKIISTFIVSMRNMQIWLNDKTNCTHARTHPRRQSVKSDSIYSYPGIDQVPGSGPSELNLSWVEYKAINMTDDPVRQSKAFCLTNWVRIQSKRRLKYLKYLRRYA